MKTFKHPVAFALLCIALGFGLAHIASLPHANAQFGAPVSPARFQISAFANDGKSAHGAYVVDSMTGVVWLIVPNQSPKRVNQNLP